MDVILSGRFLSADEALRAGLVARVVAKEAWLEEAKRVARDIATKGPVANRLAKEAVDRAFEGPLTLGVEYERRLLYLALASQDAKEGLRRSWRSGGPSSKGGSDGRTSTSCSKAPARRSPSGASTAIRSSGRA